MSINRQDPQDEVTAHLALSAGARIVRHRHDEHQVVYPSAGVVAVRTDVGCWIAPSDRALWIPAGFWHEHRFYGPTNFHCVAFALDENPLGLSEPAVVAVAPLLRELLIVCSEPDACREAEYARLKAVLIDQLRLYRAVQLLAESMPVTTVAQRTGWATASAFIDVYRRTFGHTPGTYPARPESLDAG